MPRSLVQLLLLAALATLAAGASLRSVQQATTSKDYDDELGPLAAGEKDIQGVASTIMADDFERGVHAGITMVQLKDKSYVHVKGLKAGDRPKDGELVSWRVKTQGAGVATMVKNHSAKAAAGGKKRVVNQIADGPRSLQTAPAYNKFGANNILTLIVSFGAVTPACGFACMEGHLFTNAYNVNGAFQEFSAGGPGTLSLKPLASSPANGSMILSVTVRGCGRGWCAIELPSFSVLSSRRWRSSPQITNPLPASGAVGSRRRRTATRRW